MRTFPVLEGMQDASLPIYEIVKSKRRVVIRLKQLLKNYKNDLLLILVAGIAAGILLLWINFTKSTGTFARIEQDGELLDVIDLSVSIDRTYETGENSFNRVIVKDGMISVTEASCPDQICVHQGEKKSIGETIICLPNRFVVTIMDKKEAEEYLESIRETS